MEHKKYSLLYTGHCPRCANRRDHQHLLYPPQSPLNSRRSQTPIDQCAPLLIDNSRVNTEQDVLIVISAITVIHHIWKFSNSFHLHCDPNRDALGVILRKESVQKISFKYNASIVENSSDTCNHVTQFSLGEIIWGARWSCAHCCQDALVFLSRLSDILNTTT